MQQVLNTLNLPPLMIDTEALIKVFIEAKVNAGIYFLRALMGEKIHPIANMLKQ